MFCSFEEYLVCLTGQLKTKILILTQGIENGCYCGLVKINNKTGYVKDNKIEYFQKKLK